MDKTRRLMFCSVQSNHANETKDEVYFSHDTPRDAQGIRAGQN